MYKYVKYIALFLVISCAFTFTIAAQQFHNVTTADNLSNRIVYTVVQDNYGFVWIGTSGGLNLFDGNSFTYYNYESNNPNSIPGNNISSLVICGDTLWIGTRSGLCFMDVKDRAIKRVDLGEVTDIRVVYKEEGCNTLWVGANQGLLKLNLEDFSYKTYSTENSNLSHDVVRALYMDAEGYLWVGTFDGINVLPHNSDVFTTLDLKGDFKPSIKNDLILDIKPTFNDDTNLWIGSQTALYLMNRKTRDYKVFREDNSGLSNSSVKAIYPGSDGLTWVATDFGLNVIDANHKFTSKYFHSPFDDKSLVNNVVWSISKDDSGMLWFGTDNGISILSSSNKRFEFFPIFFRSEGAIVGNQVVHINVDSKNNYWLSTYDGAIKLDISTREKETFTNTAGGQKSILLSKVSKTLEDQYGRIWIGNSGGINIWDPAKEKMYAIPTGAQVENGLRSRYINGFFEAPDGTFWVTDVHSRLHRVRGSYFDVENLYFDLIGTSCQNLIIGGNALWFSRLKGIYKIDLASLEIIKVDELEINSNITSLMWGNNNLLWVGANNELVSYNIRDKFEQAFLLNSDRNHNIYNLVEDTIGNIWGVSNSALIKFSKSKEVFDVFPVGDEIPVKGFLGGVVRMASDGSLSFGGGDGFIRFFPQNVVKSEVTPPVMITKLKILNQEVVPGIKYDGRLVLEKPITFTDEFTITYGQRSFSLEFSSMQFQGRERMQYMYRLEGEDIDWNYVSGDKSFANYSNLSSGKYTFRLKGTNNDGIWNEEETTIKITVKPPVWASPALVALYIFLLVVFSFGIIYYFTNRLRMQNELKFVKLEKEHTENMARARQQFFTNISHEFKTPLSLIIGPAEKLGKNAGLDSGGKNFVRLIENNARRLLWLNNQLMDFRQLERKSLKMRVTNFDIVEFSKNIFSLFIDKAERKNINYTFDSEFEELEVWMDLRKIETVMFNLLSNAFKFTPEDGQIMVSLKSCTLGNEKEGGSKLCISVKDSGIGIPYPDQKKVFERFYQAEEAVKMERGSGIGLTLVNEYVKLHHGQINLESTPGKGADFQVLLPLGKDYQGDIPVLVKGEEIKPLLKSVKESGDAEGDNLVSNLSGDPVVLLVEDEKEVSDFIRVSLKGKYNVKVAENGKVALEVISKQLPNLVISDVVMPEMDGIELVKRIKNNARTAHIPVILLTGQSEKEKQLEGLKSGADAYVVKPFEIELLEVRIENFLKREIKLSEYLKVEKLTNPNETEITSYDEKILEKVVNTVENQLSNPDLTIELLCKEIGLSHSVLYRKIKNLTGQTTNELIRSIRLKRAEQLLKTKKFSVAEVMDETGFSNHSYFSKCFKKVYKVTPREYIERS